MRILSKFQDFYDSALAYGFENDRLYHRQNRVWNTSDRPAPVLSPLMAELHRVANQAPTVGCLGTRMFGYRPKDHHLEVTPLVFCVGGVIHQAVWILHVRSKRLNAFSRGWKENNAIPSQQVHDKDVDRSTPFEAHPADTVLWNGPVFDVAEYQEALRPWHAVVQLSASEKQRKVVHGKDLERIEEWLKQAPPNVMDLALTERIPVAMAAQGVVSESPRLADWKFGRRMDASTLMQELSMFVGNMALNQEPPVEVEDKYRVLGHGFNEQSFRKQPTKHGLPKRAKRPHPDTPVKETTGVGATPSTGMEI